MNQKVAQAEGKENVTRVNTRPQVPQAVRLPANGDVVASLTRLQRTQGNRFVQRVLLARKAADQAQAPADVESSIQSARGNGRLLDEPLRARMETAFGANFGGVRIHADTEADMLSRALNARAFTTGQDIFFRQGEYDPNSSGSRELLAHELTHVIQQGGATRRKVATNGLGILPLVTVASPGKAAMLARAQATQIQRMCQECEEEETGPGMVQPKLMVGAADDEYEQEADAVARAVMQWESGPGQWSTPLPAVAGAERGGFGEGTGQTANESLAARAIGNRMSGDRIGRYIQRTPAPGSNFGTFRHCGFGINTRIPGFIKDLFTGDFDVDYTSGCSWIAWNAWSSVWELYDSSDRKMDSNSESPLGSYTIEASKVNSGTPGDGSAKWSLWYRVTDSQPWLTDDEDAYPYDFQEFNVYSSPIRNPNTRLVQELGPVVWQDSFTPAEDGASLHYNFSATASRSTTDSQTTSASGTVGGERSANLNFEYEGLSGGFANRLNYSATVSISRTHSVSVNTSQTTTKDFTQPNLRRGVTYNIVARPLYHIIDGSVDAINHRDGVITGVGNTLTGAIRVLKGLDIAIETGEVTPARRRWSCNASCNVEGTEPQCTGRVTGHSSGHSSEDEACREAKRDATQKAPRGCYARHCQCDCTDR